MSDIASGFSPQQTQRCSLETLVCFPRTPHPPKKRKRKGSQTRISPHEERQCILARRRTGNIEFQRQEQQDSPRFWLFTIWRGGQGRGREPEVLPLQTRYAPRELKEYTKKREDEGVWWGWISGKLRGFNLFVTFISYSSIYPCCVS